MTDFGQDVSTFPDLDPAFSPLVGSRVVAEAVARRLSTPRGIIPSCPDYGLDVRSWLNESVTTAKLDRWKREIALELQKDERIASVSATLAYDSARLELKIALEVEAADGPFRLVLLVTAVTVALLDAR